MSSPQRDMNQGQQDASEQVDLAPAADGSALLDGFAKGGDFAGGEDFAGGSGCEEGVCASEMGGVEVCQEDHRVQASRCVPCPPGTVRPKGDDPAGGDTVCSAVTCASGAYVKAHSCVMCPQGQHNVAGDDASGGDTVCDDPCVSVLGPGCGAIEQDYFKASAPKREESFGRSVVIDGNTMVVGGHSEWLHLFVRQGNVWSLQARLEVPTTNKRFNLWALDLEGDTLVVGVKNEDSGTTGIDGNQMDTSAKKSGAVYVYARKGGVWAQQAYIKASNTEAFDGYGAKVALSGDTLVVTAPTEDGGSSGVNGGSRQQLSKRQRCSVRLPPQGGRVGPASLHQGVQP